EHIREALFEQAGHQPEQKQKYPVQHQTPVVGFHLEYPLEALSLTHPVTDLKQLYRSRPRRRKRQHDVVHRSIHEQAVDGAGERSEEHTSELQSRQYLVCRLLLEKKKN